MQNNAMRLYELPKSVVVAINQGCKISSLVLYDCKICSLVWVKPERRYGLVCQRTQRTSLQLWRVFVHVERIRREKQAVQGVTWSDH